MRSSCVQRGRALIIVGSIVLSSVVPSCGGGGDTPTTPVGDFTVAVSPTNASVQSGNSTSAAIAIGRTGSFTGVVALRVDNVPTGVTATLSPTSVLAGSTTSSLTIAVANTVAPGNYTLAIAGSASGQTERSTSFTLTVTSPGSFAVSVSPSALSVRQGLSGTTAISVTRSVPFSGAVTLALEGAPTGVTGVFAPALIAAGTTASTLTVAVANTATPGTYTLTIRGTGSGVAEQTTAVALTVTPDPGSFTLSVNPVSLSVEQRLSGTATVNVSRVAPFVGTVNVVAEGLPAGVTAAFAPPSISGSVTATTLTLSVAQSVAVGNYPLTIRGTSVGVPDATATLTLVVTLFPGGFTITAGPVSVQQGQVGTVAVSITRTAPFTGAVNLFVEDGPVGVTPSLAPTVIAAGQTTAQLTYSVLATASTALYPITIRGTGTGVPEQRVTQNLTVTAPPAGTVTFEFCNPDQQPVWVGYQNGTDQWTQVAGINRRFTFPITDGKGGAAFVVPVTASGAAGYDVTLVLGTRAELIEAGTLSCTATAPTKSLSGSITGRGPNDVVNVSLGSGFAQLAPPPSTAYQLLAAELGPRDLFAVRTTFTVPIPPSTVILRRGTDYPAGSTIPLLNFGSVEALTTTQQTANFINTGTDQVALLESYVTSGGTVGAFPGISGPFTAAPFMVVPPSAALPGDLYNLRLEARRTGNEPATRAVTTTFTTATEQTMALGPMLTPPTLFNLQAAPFYQVRLQSAWQPEYNKAYFGRYQQPSRSGMFYATAGYVGTTGVDVTTPDLTTVPGWRGEWGPLAGISTTLRAAAFGWTGTTRTLFPGWYGDVIIEPGVVLRSGILFTVTTP